MDNIYAVPEQASVNITVDRVVSTDTVNGFLTVGNPYDMNDQMVFTISYATTILNMDGNQILLDSIQPGQLVQVEHAFFQTMSIPPQSPAYLVEVI